MYKYFMIRNIMQFVIAQATGTRCGARKGGSNGQLH